MDDATRLLMVKSLERYKSRLQEVEAMGWYKDETVTQNEITRADNAIADLRKQLGKATHEQELLEAVKLAYRKHHLGDDTIGWDELSETLMNVLCEAMGDEAFQAWMKPYGQSQEDE